MYKIRYLIILFLYKKIYKLLNIIITINHLLYNGGILISKNEVLNLSTRKQIYDFIVKNPGLHLREIYRSLKMSEGSIKYHLDYLNKRNLVNSVSENGYTRYYASDKLGREQNQLIGILRQEVPGQILIYLSVCLGASQIEISRDLEKHPTTIYFHLKRLTDMGVIEPLRVKNGKFSITSRKKIEATISVKSNELIYRLKNAAVLYDLMVQGLENYIDNKNAILAYEWLKWATKDIPKKKQMTFRNSLVEFENGLYKVFPHPYHV